MTECWAFVSPELVARDGTDLTADVVEIAYADLRFYPRITDAICTAQGTQVARLQLPYRDYVSGWSMIRLLWSAPAHRAIHEASLAIVQEHYTQWKTKEVGFDEEIAVFIQGLFALKLLWLEDGCSTVKLQERVEQCWNRALAERRALKPGRSKSKTSPTVTLLESVARACSEDWEQARNVWTSRYEIMLHERFLTLEPKG